MTKQKTSSFELPRMSLSCIRAGNGVIPCLEEEPYLL